MNFDKRKAMGFYHLLVVVAVLFYDQRYAMAEEDWTRAPPFTRALELKDPAMTGRDVMILQNLLMRDPSIRRIKVNGIFDFPTEDALLMFQLEHGLVPADGKLNPETAMVVVKDLMSDGYKDDGVVPENAKFKLYIPVYRNRNIETNATLFDNKGRVMYKFRVRTRGSTNKQGVPLNQLTTNGDTPTGLSTMDLNSPEPKELVKSFGPYPVLRFVKGIKGNCAMGRYKHFAVDGQETFLSNYRTGILVHTGIWDDWQPGEDMPDSNGCVHVYPDDQKKLVELLQGIGVVANLNPFGKLPYPFKVQGIVSVEQLD